MIEYLTLDPAPSASTFTIEDREYLFVLLYNEIGDFYTLEVSDEDGTDIYTTKLVYWSPVNHVSIPGINKILLVPAVESDLDSGKYAIERIGKVEFETARLFLL